MAFDAFVANFDYICVEFAKSDSINTLKLLINYVQRTTKRFVRFGARQYGRTFRLLHHACRVRALSEGQFRAFGGRRGSNLFDVPHVRLLPAFRRRYLGRQVRLRQDGHDRNIHHVPRLRFPVPAVGHGRYGSGGYVRSVAAYQLRHGTLQGQPSGAGRQSVRQSRV